MSAVRSNFLQLAFSAYQAHTNLWDGLLAGSHLLYYFQKVNIRKIGPGKGDGVFGGSSLGASFTASFTGARNGLLRQKSTG
jgi:hypothetical protein